MQGHVTGRLEIHTAIIGLDGIGMIPVACCNHLSAGQFDAGDLSPPSVEAAEALEGVGGGVIQFSLDGLPHAQILLIAACQKHFAVAERHAQTVVVGISHLQHLPFAVLEEFGSRRRYKAGGVATRHRQFSVGKERTVAEAGYVQVR